MPIGAVLGGVVARHFGLSAPYWIAAAGHLVIVGVAVVALRTTAIDAAIAESIAADHAQRDALNESR
jgi:predicted MFS family arabinose efflux permease